MLVALKSLFGPGFASGFSLRIGVAALALLVFSGIIGSSDAEAQDEDEDDTPPPLTAEAGVDQFVKTSVSGTVVTVTLTGSMSAGGVGTISYSWTQTSGTSEGLTGETTATPTFTAPTSDATLVFTLTVTDQAGVDIDGVENAKDTDTVTITVDGTAPTAAAGPDQSVRSGVTVTLNGAGSSDNNAIVSYDWAGPSTVTFTNTDGASAVSPTFTAPTQTVSTGITFTLTVADAAGNTATDTVIITIADGTAPRANAGDDDTVAPGASVTLAGSGMDAGGSVTYAWTVPSGVTFTSGAATGTPTFTAPNTLGALEFSLRVTDAAGNVSLPDRVTITVADGTAPVANAGDDQTVAQGATVTLDGSGSSDNIGVTSYAWVQVTSATDNTPLATGAETLTGLATASPTFTAPDTAGALVFSLTVADGAGNEATDTVTITVIDSGPGINRLKEIMMLFVSEINTGTATALDARMDRFRSGMAASASLSIAGQQINPAATSLTGDAEQMDSRMLSHDRASSGMAANPYQTYRATGFGRDDAGGSGLSATRGISSDDLRRDTSFNLTAGSTGGASAAGSGSGDSAVSVWGQLSTGGFEREPRDNDLVEGDVAAIHVGADYARDDWMVGLGVLHATTEGEYTERPKGEAPSAIDLELDLAAIFPYAAFNVSEKTAFWFSGIYGRGEIEVEEKGSDTPETGEVDSEIYGIAAGMTRRLWQDGGQSLSMKGDIESTEIKTGSQEGEAGVKYEIVEDSAYIAQGRIGIEGQGTRKMEGGTHLTGAFDGMAIFDSGDGREGVGVEFGGEVRAVFPVGLTLSGSGRYLVAHTEEGAQDWSLSVAARYDPGIVGQGGYFNLAPRYGQANSTQDMWSRDLVALAEDAVGDDEDALQFSFETGYRFPQTGILGRVEPYFGYDGKGGLSDGDIRFGSHVHPNAHIDLSLEAKRKFSDTGTDSSDLWLRGRVRF